ncbi:DCD domain-containing protein NRP [Cardamine amara subsp. amara]|uniref:DCD domain-containing protein NRP n=1 Tax=Cardamine amara subsp. amara TaxID=228776 RepID=A0ABD0Z0B0_CARAN
MELQNPYKDKNEKALEALAVETAVDAGKDGAAVVEAEAEKAENVVVETSAGENINKDEKFLKTSMDVNLEEAVLKAPVEENKAESVDEPSVLASVEASSSGMNKKPQGLRAKTKIVKKVKKVVKKIVKKGTAVHVAGEENVTGEQSVNEALTVANEQSADPSLGESEKEIKKVADSLECSSGKEKDSETSLRGNDMESKKELEESAEAPQLAHADDVKVAGPEPSGEETVKEVKEKARILKSVGKRLQKGKKVKDSAADTGASTGGNIVEAEKAIEGSVEAPENALPVEKKQARKVKAKAKLRKTPAAVLGKTEVDKGDSQLAKKDQDNNNSLVNEQSNGVEKSNLLEGNTGEGDQQKTVDEADKQQQLTEGKTGLAEGRRHRKKRRGNQVLGSNKKAKTEVGATADVTQQRTEEKEKQLVESKEKETDGNGKAKIGGLIFMCNAKTRPDCFRFSVMGVSEKRKDYVMGVKPGLKLFLYDYELKLLYGIFQASSAGGMKLERKAFGGSFPAQVRFKVFSDCIPLPESEFKKAIRESYNKNKFKTELTHKQVFKLKKLFRPAALPAQVTHTQPIPVPRDADKKRSDRNRYAAGSSRTQPARTQERRRPSPPPRREEQPRDLFLSEREYRTYGLRRVEPTQQYAIPPPDASYRELVPLESYHPSIDRDRLLRQAEIERHDRREVRLLPLPERDYHTYDHPSSRQEIHARNSPNPPTLTVALDSYRRDTYYGYRAPERPPRTYVASSPERPARTRTYLASPERPPRTYMASRREDDDLYSRYVTPDSLAEYYRESRRYSEPEFLLPSQVSSRYAYSGSLPYSHR